MGSAVLAEVGAVEVAAEVAELEMAAALDAEAKDVTAERVAEIAADAAREED